MHERRVPNNWQKQDDIKSHMHVMAIWRSKTQRTKIEPNYSNENNSAYRKTQAHQWQVGSKL